MPETTYVDHPLLAGYRIGSDGSVLSEWRWTGRGKGKNPAWIQSGHWEPIVPLVDKRGRRRYKLRATSGVYVRQYETTLLKLGGFQ